MNIDPSIHALWDRSPTPQAWSGGTEPADNLIWKDGHPQQVKDLLAMSHLLGLEVRVAGQHTSKSVGLPVGMFRFACPCDPDFAPPQYAYFFTRNNFYDLKLVALTTAPLCFPYDVVHSPMTAEAYAAEKQRSYDYCSGDANFDATLYESDAWMSKWSGSSILRDGDRIYRCSTTYSCYYEGIDDLAPAEAFTRYEHSKRSFAAEFYQPEQLMRVMRAVQWDIRRYARSLEDRARYGRIDPSERHSYQTRALDEAIADLQARGV